MSWNKEIVFDSNLLIAQQVIHIRNYQFSWEWKVQKKKKHMNACHLILCVQLGLDKFGRVKLQVRYVMC